MPPGATVWPETVMRFFQSAFGSTFSTSPILSRIVSSSLDLFAQLTACCAEIDRDNARMQNSVFTRRLYRFTLKNGNNEAAAIRAALAFGIRRLGQVLGIAGLLAVPRFARIARILVK